MSCASQETGVPAFHSCVKHLIGVGRRCRYPTACDCFGVVLLSVKCPRVWAIFHGFHVDVDAGIFAVTGCCGTGTGFHCQCALASPLRCRCVTVASSLRRRCVAVVLPLRCCCVDVKCLIVAASRRVDM